MLRELAELRPALPSQRSVLRDPVLHSSPGGGPGPAQPLRLQDPDNTGLFGGRAASPSCCSAGPARGHRPHTQLLHVTGRGLADLTLFGLALRWGWGADVINRFGGTVSLRPLGDLLQAGSCGGYHPQNQGMVWSHRPSRDLHAQRQGHVRRPQAGEGPMGTIPHLMLM